MNFSEISFFTVVSFAQTSFLFPEKTSCFQISFWTLFLISIFVVFSPKRPFYKSSSFFFSEKIKMFLKNLVEKLCCVSSLLLLFLFSLFSCVFLFKKKKRWKTAWCKGCHRAPDQWQLDLTRSTTSPHAAVCSRELPTTQCNLQRMRKMVLLGLLLFIFLFFPLCISLFFPTCNHFFFFLENLFFMFFLPFSFCFDLFPQNISSLFSPSLCFSTFFFSKTSSFFSLFLFSLFLIFLFEFPFFTMSFVSLYFSFLFMYVDSLFMFPLLSCTSPDFHSLCV